MTHSCLVRSDWVCSVDVMSGRRALAKFGERHSEAALTVVMRTSLLRERDMVR